MGATCSPCLCLTPSLAVLGAKPASKFMGVFPLSVFHSHFSGLFPGRAAGAGCGRSPGKEAGSSFFPGIEETTFLLPNPGPLRPIPLAWLQAGTSASQSRTLATSGPTRHCCRGMGSRLCLYERIVSLRPAGFWRVLGTSLELVFSRSRVG